MPACLTISTTNTFVCNRSFKPHLEDRAKVIIFIRISNILSTPGFYKHPKKESIPPGSERYSTN